VCAFAFSGGVEVHARILRTEMVAASCVVFAFMILILAAQRATPWRPLAIAAAAALCVLGLENKIHAILLIALLPALLLAFGADTGASTAFWADKSKGWTATAAAGLAALVLVLATLPLVRTGLNPPATLAVSFAPLLGGVFGVYQAVLAAWIGACVIAFAVIWQIAVTETIATLFAIVAGAALGLLALKVQYNVDNASIVLNPLEKMLQIADLHGAQGAGMSAGVDALVGGIVGVLRRYTFVLTTSARPTVFLIWLIIPGIVWAWRQGARQIALQAALLVLTATAVDTLGVRRGLKVEYFVFTDPLIILAGALLLSRLGRLMTGRWTYPIGIALIALHIGISQAEPVKYALMRSGPEGICVWNLSYLPQMPVPWCALPAKRP
jgi:hypothetical protein